MSNEEEVERWEKAGLARTNLTVTADAEAAKTKLKTKRLTNKNTLCCENSN